MNPSLLSAGSSPIADDEPVFLVRASDQAFAATLSAWAFVHGAAGGDTSMIEAVHRHIRLAAEWQDANIRKVADATRDTMAK